MTTTRFTTHVNLPTETRSQLIDTLNGVLAASVDLTYQVKQAHWNIKGPWFFARHELFDKLADRLRGWSDDVAERASTLGGYARGTVRMAAQYSVLEPFDEGNVEGKHHMRALVDRYQSYTKLVRQGVAVCQAGEDVATEDLMTEILRGAELDMWFLESHLNA